MCIEVKRNKFAFIDWTEPITTILIEKKGMVDGFRKYFDALWQIAEH